MHLKVGEGDVFQSQALGPKRKLQKNKVICVCLFNNLQIKPDSVGQSGENFADILNTNLVQQF